MLTLETAHDVLCKLPSGQVPDEENIAEGDMATLTVRMTRKNLAEGEASVLTRATAGPRELDLGEPDTFQSRLSSLDQHAPSESSLWRGPRTRWLLQRCACQEHPGTRFPERRLYDQFT